MKYINIPIQLISALKPSQFRPFKDAILKKEFKKYLDHVFKGEDRIYLPFEMSYSIKVPKNIENFLSKKNLEVVDYKAGIAKNKEGRLSRIGKVLSKDEEGKKLLDLFNVSRSGINKKDDLTIVISRHPYDIAGMSTGRGRGEPGDSETGWGWSSCMNLRSGKNSHYVTKDIENGTIVAYVINVNDKNINKPIARLLIKQYINIKNENDKILFPDYIIYGENIKGFRKKLIEWLKTFQEFKGTYTLNSNLYNDFTGEQEDGFGDPAKPIGFGDKENESDQIRLLYYINNPEDSDARNDDFWKIRDKWYYDHPKDKQAKFDYDENIRKWYYKQFPEDKDIKHDESSNLRLLYYKNNPEDKDAKNDINMIIRYNYYKLYPNDKDAKYDIDTAIRVKYYKNNPEDKDAKKSKDSKIRKQYYELNPDDTDAKEDIDVNIRGEYFDNHPDDEDAKYDSSAYIVLQYYDRHPEIKEDIKIRDNKFFAKRKKKFKNPLDED